MILGIGNDMIEIERVKKACEKQAFLVRCYTEKEIELCAGKAATLAGNFAVKEAVAKSFGTGFRGFETKDIEVLRDELGKPYVNLYGGAKEIYEKIGATAIYVSITDTKDHAAAMAVLEK
ncbi:MAG: holo-ACP synthase [Lachnospiraceae bacterium]|nr:holo-ACP synthase [Lachnospiraceae bacterium]